MARPYLTPCMICEKAVIYLWSEDVIAGNESTNLASASNITIRAHYGSEFDCNEYAGIICDECLDRAIQRRRVRFVTEHPMFG
jgi:hypothetical protein